MALPPLNGLALFAGAAGLELGVARFLAGFGRSSRTVCFVEREVYAAAVLVSRMAEGRLDPAPIWDDVVTFDGRPWRGVVDYIAGGFPCQDISNAGKRAGLDAGERSGLWREYARLIGEVRPRFVFVENVRPLLVRGIDTVLGDLASLGFDAEWLHLRASDVGAPHGRDRLFLMAHAHGGSVRDESGRRQRTHGPGTAGVARGGKTLADPERAERRADATAGSGGELGRDAGREASGGSRRAGEAVADAGDGLLPIARRGSKGRARTRSTSSTVADSDGGGPRPRIGRRREAGGLAQPKHGSEHVADADEGGRGSGAEIRAGESVALERRRSVADADDDGLVRRGARDDDDGRDASGRIAHGCDAGLGAHGPTPWRDVDGRIRAWPPGPREADGWRVYLEQYPELAPAIEKPARPQPAFRGGADGMALGLVLRVDSLRLCGNGVVPYQCALAFRLLAARNPSVEAALRGTDLTTL